jgi:hypothetical protein
VASLQQLGCPDHLLGQGIGAFALGVSLGGAGAEAAGAAGSSRVDFQRVAVWVHGLSRFGQWARPCMWKRAGHSTLGTGGMLIYVGS